MDKIEITAVVFTLLSVWLTIRNNIWCWPTGIVGIIFYFLLFQKDKDFSNCVLQVLFLFQSIYGWYSWNKKPNQNVNLSRGIIISLEISLVLLFIFFFWIFNQMIGGNQTSLDAITTSLSIMAMFLISKRRLEAWFYWFVANIFYIILFLSNNHYLSAFIYFLFLFTSTLGFFNWKRLYHEHRRSF